MTNDSKFFNQQDLTAAGFLRDYWQKKPLLLRQAFPDFQPELDADDIAGLACEEMAESRLIMGHYPNRDWALRYGPFKEEDFATLPPRDWTLLVQDVEKHYPPLQALLAAFGFLPRWRIDDLMVSVAAPGGSVGPHVDQYDVFLLQAAGHRRWEISTTFDSTLLEGCDLNVLRAFAPEQAWELDAGDMLYLPPGVAHHGIALEPNAGLADASGTAPPCMTWSIGMRAPSAADILQALGEWLAVAPDEGGRYKDPEIVPQLRPGEIDDAALQGLRDLLRPVLEDSVRFPAFIGAFLSRYRLAHEPAPPPRPISPARLQQEVERGATLHHNPWTRLAWLRTTQGALLFASGSVRPCSIEAAERICDPTRLQALTADQLKGESSLLCELINEGHVILEPL
jgi:50S ribosomal protein L16 3-hydroxylase